MAGLGIVIPRNGGGGPVITPEVIYASDNFASPDGSAQGRTLNNGMGGAAARTFESASSSAFAVSGGTLRRTTSGGAAAVLGVAMPQADYSLYVKMVALSVQSLSLLVRRSTISGGTDNRLNINPDGSLGGSSTWVPGDVIGYRVRGTNIEWVKNGIVFGTATANNTAAGFAGIACAANCMYEIDDFALKLPA